MNVEPPRRIAFVSDKVFEPTPWQRLVAALNPATLLASTALAALVSFGVTKLGTSPSTPTTNAPMVQAAVSDAAPNADPNLDARIQNAVKLALAENDARHKEETAQLIRATERRMRSENARSTAETMAIMESNFEYLRKRQAQYLRASADTVNFR
jgi:hypothetical protein